MEHWNERLKQARLDYGCTLKDVATALNTTQQSLIEYEKGNVYPKLDVLIALCDFYSVSLNFIVYGNENAIIISNELQQSIETIISLYIFDKISINDNIIIINDSTLKKYVNYFVMFFNKYDKTNLKNLERAITAIKNI